MFTLSAFADEISPEPLEQIAVLKSCGVRHIEFRSILKTNVLKLTDLQVNEFKTLLDQHGFRLSAIGSPIGKSVIDQPFEHVREQLERALELCKRFETRNIRVFSFYPPDGATWPDWRQPVIERMVAMVGIAEKAGVRLVHENEHRIYGEAPDRVRDLLQTVSTLTKSTAFGAAYDPANFVFGGFDPWAGWQASKDHTVHFHIKDWKTGAAHGSIPGEGAGQIERVMADAVSRAYVGFATLEPHLLGGGPTGGHTGPELFPKAVEAYRQILLRVGAKIAA